MNILAFEPFGNREGHFGVYASQVCQELSLAGETVTLVTTSLVPGKFISGKPRFKIIETETGSRSTTESRKGFFKAGLRGLSLITDNARALLRLIRVYRKGSFDVVHLFDCEPVSTAILLYFFDKVIGFRFRSMHVVVHSPDPSLQGHGNVLYQLYGKLSRPMFRKVIEVFSLSITAHGKWTGDDLIRLLGLKSPHPPVHYVPYGSTPPGEIPSREEARKALGISFNGPMLLFFGMLRRDKGVEILIQAMSRIQEDCRLLLAGKPFDWDINGVREMINRSGCDEKIIAHLGYIEEEKINYYFAAADVLVLPYRKQYLGAAGPLKTAFGFGLPVIASRVHELEFFLDQSPIGMGTIPDSSPSLEEGIRRFLVLSEKERKKMSENSRNLAGGCTWEVLAGEFLKIYKIEARTP